MIGPKGKSYKLDTVTIKVKKLDYASSKPQDVNRAFGNYVTNYIRNARRTNPLYKKTGIRKIKFIHKNFKKVRRI